MTRPIDSVTTWADVGAAWRRSAMFGVDVELTELPFIGDPTDAAKDLRRAAEPVLAGLGAQIAGTSFAVVLTGGDGRITFRHAGEASTLRVIDRHNIDVGFSLAESDVGANGAGTALETGRLAMVVGDDHYVEAFRGFACAGAPIWNPMTGRLAGTIGLLCRVSDVGPLLPAATAQLAQSVRNGLFNQATLQEQRLLQGFLERRRRVRGACFAVGPSVFIGGPGINGVLGPVDQASLWDAVERAIDDRDETAELEWAGGTITLRCDPLRVEGLLIGAVVVASNRPRPAELASASSFVETLGSLVGSSRSWQQTVDAAHSAFNQPHPLLVVGERGTGRRAVAIEVAATMGPSVAVLDSADVLLEGAQEWAIRCRRAIQQSQAVVILGVDSLPGSIAEALLSAVSSDAGSGRVIGTSEVIQAEDRSVTALLGRLGGTRIAISPLRERRSDIREIASALAARRSGKDIDPSALELLGRLRWPGNVAELKQVVEFACDQRSGGAVIQSDLPDHVRVDSERRPLHGLRQQEADAIVRALALHGNNKQAAADHLGISRSTLYRRIVSYGL